MPTRSIQVKLVVPRGQDGLPLRHSLWATHDAVNAATHFYESHLLLMRGDSYVMGESEIEKTAVINELRALIEAARKRNGVSGGEVDDEAIALLRKLYEHLVPSSVGKDGTAQAANAFIGPLTDPESQGFLGVFDKLSRPVPNWVALVAAEDPSGLSVANDWLKSSNSDAWMDDTGSPAGWVRLARKGDPEWPQKFAEKLEDLKKEASEGQCQSKLA